MSQLCYEHPFVLHSHDNCMCHALKIKITCQTLIVTDVSALHWILIRSNSTVQYLVVKRSFVHQRALLPVMGKSVLLPQKRCDRRKKMAKRESAARKWVVRALCAGATSLNLNSIHIKQIPKCVSRLTNLSVLLLNNNSITGLPAELLSLHQVSLLSSFVCAQLLLFAGKLPRCHLKCFTHHADL